MKIAFIHLSDLHISSKKDYDRISFQDKLDFLSDSCFENVSEIVLLITGDIAGMGNYDNYIYAGKILESIKGKVKEKFGKELRIIAVPGNHDLSFSKEEVTEFKNMNTFSLDYENEIVSEETRLTNYKNFCNAYSIPYVDFVKNQIVKFGNDFSIEFVLINSSFFSRFNHIDYGKHYIPREDLYKIAKPTTSEIKIGLIHHTLQWFEPESKLSLNDLIKNNIQVMFVGHEHYFELVDSKTKTDVFEVLTVNGGAFFEKDTKCSEFNVCFLDTNTGVFSISKLSWNVYKTIYEFSTFEHKNVNLTKGNKKFILEQDKMQDLKYLLDKRDMDTFYVFPDLRYQKEANGKIEDDEVHDISSFLSVIDGKKLIEIIGKNHNGKTAFAKYLYSHFYKRTDKLPIILDAIDFLGKYDKWEKDTVSLFYGEKVYEKFCRLDKEEKVLIIDNFHLIKKDEKLYGFLNELMKKYYQVFIIEDKRASESLSKELNCIFEFGVERGRFEILNLKPKKRKQLIFNVCCADKSYISREQINCEADDIELFLRSQPSFVKFDPVLIMQLTSKYITCTEHAKIDVFHDVFAESLSQSVKKGFEDDVRLGTLLLSRIAYSVYVSGEYPFTRSVIDNVVLSYNEEYGNTLDCDEKYNLILKTGIIKKSVNNTLVFESNNHLSFYIAKEIQRLKGEEDDYKVYNQLLENICTGINGDIILYLSLLENSVKEGLTIVKASKKNLESTNLLKISDLHFYDKKIQIIEKQDVEETAYKRREENNVVREEKEYMELERVNFFRNDDLTPEEKQIGNAITYLELNSKLFSGFYRNLKVKPKQELLDILYTQTNQVLYLIIKPFVDQYFEIQKDIVSEMVKNEEFMKNKQLEIRREKAEDLFEQLFTFLEYNTILNVYSSVSIFSTSKQNVDEIIKYNYDKSNELFDILNLYFIQRKNDKSVFYECLKETFRKTKNVVIKNLITAIFNRYIIVNNIKIGNMEQGVIASLKMDEKSLFIRQALKSDE